MRFVEQVESRGTDMNTKPWLQELQYFGLKEAEQQEAVQNCTISSFTLCTLLQIFTYYGDKFTGTCNMYGCERDEVYLQKCS
jgi:hypothetical protein